MRRAVTLVELLIAMALLLGATLLGQVEEPEAAEEPTLEERIEEARQDRIEAMEANIDAWKAELRTVPRAERGQLGRLIKAQQVELAKVKNRKLPFILILPEEPKVGDFGKLPQVNVVQPGRQRRVTPIPHRVSEVIDDDEMLVNFVWSVRIVRTVGGPTIQSRTLTRAPGGARQEEVELEMLVEGLTTAGLADGDEWGSDGWFEVTGTRQLETVDGGIRTVKVLKLVSD